jgi:hypothetical protein
VVFERPTEGRILAAVYSESADHAGSRLLGNATDAEYQFCDVFPEDLLEEFR